MGTKISALFIDTRRTFARSMREILSAEFEIEEEDSTITLGLGVARHSHTSYDVCFIGDTIKDNLDAFFLDIEKLGRKKSCVFVRVKPALSSDVDRKRAGEPGFDLQISQLFTQEDKDALVEKVLVERHAREIERRSIDVHDAVNVMLKEIDRAASDAKRGKKRNIRSIARGLVEIHGAFDQEILERYFEGLITKTESSTPMKKALKTVPKALLTRNLPHLDENGYHGASLRVWEMLTERFGDHMSEHSGAATHSVVEEPSEVLPAESGDGAVEDSEENPQIG